MRLICAGDLHLRNTVPTNRIDNYLLAMWCKFITIVNEAEENDIIILPGDIGNSYKIDEITKAFLSYLLKDKKVFAVWGQHDLYYRNADLNKTFLGQLHLNNIITILEPIERMSAHTAFYGVSYGQDIPPLIHSCPLHILVIHKMISDKDYWQGYVMYDNARMFLKNNDFDLIICGDNHNTFTVSYEGRHLINCGSLMRNRIDQWDHKPMYVIYDMETGLLKWKYLPIDPPEIVFKTEELKHNKTVDHQRFEAFIQSLRLKKQTGFQFEKILEELIIKSHIDKEVENIIHEAMPKGKQNDMY
jgi:predicted phosphodiesterase